VLILRCELQQLLQSRFVHHFGQLFIGVLFPRV
jgi:hypothetical protein